MPNPLARTSPLGFLGATGAGGTTYVDSVQHFSITISSGNTSATATITSVDTSKSFVIFGGNTLSGSSFTIPYLQLTNGTTVTATRGGTTDTMVVWGCVVECTTSLVDTIQQGTISMTSGGGTTATDTITSVDTSLSAVFYLGSSGDRIATLDLTNATTVTAEVETAGNQTVGYVVVEFQSAAINNIEKSNNFYSDSSATNTDTLTASVTVANTMVAYGGQRFKTAFTDLYTGELTATDTLTFTRDGTATNDRAYHCTVIEFVSGVINSRQSGEIDMQNVTSATATITSVTTTKTALSFMGWRSALSGFNFDEHYQGVDLTNSTTVTGHIGTSTNNSMGVGYEAIEFN